MVEGFESDGRMVEGLENDGRMVEGVKSNGGGGLKWSREITKLQG